MSILHSPQAPGLRLFNMQESPKVETFGPALNQVRRANYLKYFLLNAYLFNLMIPFRRCT